MILILPRIFKIENFVDAWTEKEPDLFFPFAAALLEARSKHGNYHDGGAPSANMVGLTGFMLYLPATFSPGTGVRNEQYTCTVLNGISRKFKKEIIYVLLFTNYFE